MDSDYKPFQVYGDFDVLLDGAVIYDETKELLKQKKKEEKELLKQKKKEEEKVNDDFD